ncbi:MAG: sulfatase-like hydrolase/transferase, partial [Prolixibacteraceae bacterium]|nr:sulfatase-like hydrolase/transferase [Prolixibacteraceae bacterium]
DLISNKAVAWLQNRNKENPFLLYMPYTAPHSPYQGPNDKIERPLKADEWNLGSRETYIEMTEALDNGIGKILNYLTENELDEETLVIFVSDNGGTKFANNGIFSGFKGQVYEGGIHVPCIIRWPGKVQANSTSKQTCISMDLTKSVINLLDSENESLELDGYDILNHVIQNKPDFDRSLFWRAKRGDRIQKAIRDGDFKYLIRLDNDSISDEKLFNLKTDPSELNDLLKSSDEKAEELKTKLNEWEKDVKSPRLEVFENILR